MFLYQFYCKVLKQTQKYFKQHSVGGELADKIYISFSVTFKSVAILVSCEFVRTRDDASEESWGFFILIKIDM